MKAAWFLVTNLLFFALSPVVMPLVMIVAILQDPKHFYRDLFGNSVWKHIWDQIS